MYWAFGSGTTLGGTGSGPRGFFARVALRLPRRHFGGVFGLLRGGQFARPRLDHGPRALQRRHALFPPPQFVRNIQAGSLRLLGVGGFGARH